MTIAIRAATLAASQRGLTLQHATIPSPHYRIAGAVHGVNIPDRQMRSMTAARFVTLCDTAIRFNLPDQLPQRPVCHCSKCGDRNPVYTDV